MKIHSKAISAFAGVLEIIVEISSFFYNLSAAHMWNKFIINIITLKNALKIEKFLFSKLELNK